MVLYYFVNLLDTGDIIPTCLTVMFILQDAQKGVGVFLLISSDGIKVISADGQVKYGLVLLTYSAGP